MKAVLRKGEVAVMSDNSEIISLPGLSIDPERVEVRVDDKPIELTATEFRILHFLALKPGWVFSRAQIVDAVRGEDYPVTDRSVDVHIVSLRRKLGKYGDLIGTVRGVGYRFLED